MKHPTDDQLYDLAKKIAAEEDFSQEEKEHMRHIADCDDCYHMICCLLAMQDVVQHISDLSQEVSPAVFQVPVREKISAVIRLAVSTVNTALNQIEDGANAWAFRRAPMALAGVRSIGKRPANATKKLTDSGNSQTFVAYDPNKKLLMIQIDSRDCESEPHASILLPNGNKVEVAFEKREHLYWAEVQGLEDGEYELILQKETDKEMKTLAEELREEILLCADEAPPTSPIDF